MLNYIFYCMVCEFYSTVHICSPACCGKYLLFPLHVSRNIYILQYCMLYLFRFLFFIAFMRNDLSLRLKEHQNIIFLFIPLHFVNIVSVGRVLVAVLVVVIGGGGWLFVGLATLPLPIRGCERGSVGDEIGLPPPSPHTTH